MRVLLDACVWSGVAAELRAEHWDVASVAEWPSDPGDRAILDAAHAEARVLVTLDKDFGELAVRWRHRHVGIARLAGVRLRDQAKLLVEVLPRFAVELESGAILTVTQERVRIRRP